jgi:hypothetical protein
VKLLGLLELSAQHLDLVIAQTELLHETFLHEVLHLPVLDKDSVGPVTAACSGGHFSQNGSCAKDIATVLVGDIYTDTASTWFGMCVISHQAPQCIFSRYLHF